MLVLTARHFDFHIPTEGAALQSAESAEKAAEKAAAKVAAAAAKAEAEAQGVNEAQSTVQGPTTPGPSKKHKVAQTRPSNSSNSSNSNNNTGPGTPAAKEEPKTHREHAAVRIELGPHRQPTASMTVGDTWYVELVAFACFDFPVF